MPFQKMATVTTRPEHFFCLFVGNMSPFQKEWLIANAAVETKCVIKTWHGTYKNIKGKKVIGLLKKT